MALKSICKTDWKWVTGIVSVLISFRSPCPVSAEVGKAKVETQAVQIKPQSKQITARWA